MSDRAQTIPWQDRCPTHFERRSKGKRYVNRRWQCPRPKMKGLPYCSYCEPYSEKLKRKEANQSSAAGARDGD